MFHPFDMASEFSGPVISVLAFHMFWKVDMVLIASVLIIHLWYALDHSDFLKLPHTKHHSHINSMFSIYINKYITLRRPDHVRKMIRTIEQKCDF